MSPFNHHLLLSAGLGLLAGVVSGCPADVPTTPEPTIPDNIFSALGDVGPWASSDQQEAFGRGMVVMTKRFSPAQGLGPEFNTTFCGACHERPTFGGSASHYRDFPILGQELDGGLVFPVAKSGVHRQFTVDGKHPVDERANVILKRNPIPFFGAGLMAEIYPESILANADPEDEDGDGISGRVNWDRGFVGRFGRKSQTVSLEGFIRGPLFNHLGVTSDPLTNERKAQLPVPSASVEALGGADAAGIFGGVSSSHGQAAATEAPTVDNDAAPDPELGEQELFDLVSAVMLMAAPRPEPEDSRAAAGRERFETIGCESCHRHTLESPRGLIPLYSDLLIHDMGPDLADGFPMGLATGTEFRTQPLWGVAAVGPYLHDGRADTLHDAILWHGGEAQESRDAYAALSASEQEDIAYFMERLGGADQYSPGLLPPEAALPEQDEPGSPIPNLNTEDLARFERGRALFDRDFSVTEGMGPHFNGDACRSCHFDPAVGGSGPQGLDVMRQGIIDGSTVLEPTMGTMAHHHSTAYDALPPLDPASDLFEHRQTPPIFGLGLLEGVPADTIIAMADPDDLDSDGISGIARILPDGALGRLGWKANIPTMGAFSRDAMSAELGLTLPDDGSPFGILSDDDGADDPEVTPEQLMDLTFFMDSLAPIRPAQQPSAAALAVFEDIGCGDCHIPELPGPAGAPPVRAYTDLLLHDVQPADFLGVPDGPIDGREFRTAPLWGLRFSAPYMHDGASYTAEDAILRHFSEGEASRLAYEALNSADRELLLSFLESL